MNFNLSDFTESILIYDEMAAPVSSGITAQILSHQTWMKEPWKDWAFAMRNEDALVARSLIGYTVEHDGIAWNVNGYSYHNNRTVVLLSCELPT